MCYGDYLTKQVYHVKKRVANHFSNDRAREHSYEEQRFYIYRNHDGNRDYGYPDAGQLPDV